MSMKLILSFALVCLAVTFVTVECSPEPDKEAAESAKEKESKPKDLLSYGVHLASSSISTLNRDFKGAAGSAKEAIKKVDPVSYGLHLASSSISTLKGAAESAKETIKKVDPVSKTLNAASTAITQMGEVHKDMMPKQMAEFFAAKP